MLTETDYKVLKRLTDGIGAYRIDIINSLDPQTQCNAVDSSFALLKEAGCIIVTSNDFARLSPLGWHELTLHEEMRQNAASAEKEKRFNRKVKILELLLSFATFFGGILLEHYVGLVAWCESAFQAVAALFS